MKFLNNIVKKDPDFSRLLELSGQGSLPIAVSGIGQTGKALALSAIIEETKKQILAITEDEASAIALRDDLESLGTKTLYLPSRDYNLNRLIGRSKEYEYERIHTLSAVAGGDFAVLVVSLDAAIQFTLPPEALKGNTLTLRAGDAVSHGTLLNSLVSLGYERADSVEGAGQFSARGGIIDIFSVSSDAPVRLEFWGDEIDNIAYFDILSQRRSEQISEIKITAANELVYEPGKLKMRLEDYLKRAKKLTDKQRAQIESDIERLKTGLYVCADNYISLLYETPSTVFDYMSDCLVAACETGNINERLRAVAKIEAADVEALLESGQLCPKCTKLTLNKTELYSKLQNAIFLENFPRSSYEVPLKALININFKRNSAWNGDISALCEDIAHIRRLGGTAVILAGEARAARVLSEQLLNGGITAANISADERELKAGVYVVTGGLSSGFELPSAKFILVSYRYISKEKKTLKRQSKNARAIGSLDELQNGDYVVHASHGIGIFAGINQIKNGGIIKDYIKIKYAGSDILYVPVTQLDLVSKYIGAASEEKTIKLNRLGGSDWNKTRSRVRAAVKNMAKELTALYAKRMSTKGYAFSPDTDLQNNFERRFEYEETEDQIRCVNEIKRDMERGTPMDRLLCGDVGFGKTEVALRAAFKCVSEGKQCALLVPTTILAMQHYNTVLRRFGDMPLEVRLLNRFVPKSEQKKTVAGLKSGRVDMVVGTHRIISNDISFKNIGLVIIDEEQRFGVAQKEKLKQMYPFVDILTLSATPIPRTLNMAMSGLRDMSSIDEAPGDRFPVQSYVLEQSSTIIIDAINKELRRGGQVYYLHNRVESIVACAARLKEKIPSARIGIAHGKMSEDELSDIWKRLLEHEIDILVCTTIIETGVDVPNVNTLIIEDADRMGLSQLHQLRGRVGRSPRRAYAYFCFRPQKALSEVASKRLEAIRQFTEFGSGFKIALRDLEIRGAGSILGGEQHGNMEAVGYDMYLKLLSEAVNEENGVEAAPQIDCTVDLNISAHIPESYIESLPARLGIYKRIADIADNEDAADVIDELCDRFGEPPRAVMGLIDIARLRARAKASGIYEITSTPTVARLATAKIDESVAARLAEGFGDSFTLAASGKPAYIIRLNGKKLYDVVAKLSKVL